jgi:hypothetical protein
MTRSGTPQDPEVNNHGEDCGPPGLQRALTTRARTGNTAVIVNDLPQALSGDAATAALDAWNRRATRASGAGQGRPGIEAGRAARQGQ